MTSEPTSILCFRNGSIGNTLAAIPALRALRNSFPKATIDVVVDSVGFQLLEHCPWVNRLIVYEKHGRDRGPLAYWRLVRSLHNTRPTHAILFKRFFRNGLLSYLSGAKVRAGFRTDGRAPFLNLAVDYEEAVPVVDLNLRLASAIGATSTDRRYEITLTDEDRQQAGDILLGLNLTNKPLVVAHYGGLTTQPDFMPLGRFAEVLNAVAPANEPVILIGHGARETEWASKLASIHSGATPVCNLPLRVTAALIEQSGLFVGFNSGPAHIAAAVRVPEVIFYRPDDGVANEIRKWCPPFEHAHPLVPPLRENEAAWKIFVNELQAESEQYSKTTQESVGRTPR